MKRMGGGGGLRLKSTTVGAYAVRFRVLSGKI